MRNGSKAFVVVLLTIIFVTLIGVRLLPRVEVRITKSMELVPASHFLFEMIERGDSLEKIKKVLIDQPSLVAECKVQGNSLLMQAAHCERRDIVELLLEMDADPDGGSENALNSPLSAAVLNDDVDIARLLLEHGANPFLKYESGIDMLDANPRTIAYYATHEKLAPQKMVSLFEEFCGKKSADHNQK